MRKKLAKTLFLALSLVTLLSTTSCSQPTEPLPEGIIWSFETGDSILSSPVIFNESIIFGSNDQNLYSVDLNSHQENWKFDSNEVINSTPLMDANSVIFTTPSTCYALNAETGEELWHYTLDETPLAPFDRFDYHSPSPLLYKDLVIFTSQSGDIYGLNRLDGSVAWKYRAENTFEIRSTPFIEGDILCFGDSEGNCVAVDLTTQTTLWKADIGRNLIHASFIYKDYAYFSGRDTVMAAFNLSDGSEKWIHTDPVRSWFTADIIVQDDILYVPGSDNFEIAALDYATGELVNTIPSDKNIFSKPLIDNNALYFCDGDVYKNSVGNLFRYDLKTQDSWSLSFDQPIYSSPVMHDGILYFGCNDHNLYAVNPKK